jgi:hypothetical protein
MVLLGGCHALPAGRLDAARPEVAVPRRGSVYLVRGWQDLWSDGIDRLCTEIRDTGAGAEVYRESQWQDLADAIDKRYRADPAPGPLVLIGFSFGADDVLRIAAKLQRHSIRPDLVITIDPVTPPPVPANVRSCYDYYQTNGIWDVFPWLRGVALTSSAPGQLINIDIRRQRPDWVKPSVSHATIAGNAGLHREIVKRVTDVCGS